MAPPRRVTIFFDGNTAGLDRSLRTVTGSLGRFALQQSGAAVAGVGFAAVVRDSVEAFATFDSALTRSQAIMGDLTDNQMVRMEEAALNVARTTTFAANEAAEAFFFLTSAGLDAEQALASIDTVSQFALAGQFELSKATDLLTDAQSALGLTVNDTSQNLRNMTRVSDVLVKANTLANASVEQFSTALTQRSGAAIRQYNISVEEGVAVLAAFADQGIKAERAGTLFGILIRDLTTKAVKNAEAFDRFGIAVFNSQGQVNNLADIVADLEMAFATLSPEQRKAALLQLGFADRSQIAIEAVLGLSEEIAGYEQQLRDAGGITEEVADKQLEAFAAQMTLVKNRITEVGIALGSELAPGVLATFDEFAEFVEIVQDATQALDEFFGVSGSGSQVQSPFDLGASLRGRLSDVGGDANDIDSRNPFLGIQGLLNPTRQALQEDIFGEQSAGIVKLNEEAEELLVTEQVLNEVLRQTASSVAIADADFASLGGTTADLQRGFEDLPPPIQETVDLLGDLESGLAAFTNFTGDQLTRRVVEDVDNLIESLEGFEQISRLVSERGVINIDLEEGREVQELFEDLNRALADNAEAYATGEVTQIEFNRTNAEVVEQLDRVIARLGLSADQAEVVRQKYLTVPDDIQTLVEILGIDQAISEIAKIYGAIPQNINVPIGVNSSAARRTANFGGFVDILGAATGDVADSPRVRLIGEYPGARSNPELVSPQRTMAETFRSVLREEGGRGGPSITFENVTVDGTDEMGFARMVSIYEQMAGVR